MLASVNWDSHEYSKTSMYDWQIILSIFVAFCVVRIKLVFLFNLLSKKTFSLIQAATAGLVSPNIWQKRDIPIYSHRPVFFLVRPQWRGNLNLGKIRVFMYFLCILFLFHLNIIDLFSLSLDLKFPKCHIILVLSWTLAFCQHLCWSVEPKTKHRHPLKAHLQCKIVISLPHTWHSC